MSTKVPTRIVQSTTGLTLCTTPFTKEQHTAWRLLVCSRLSSSQFSAEPLQRYEKNILRMIIHRTMHTHMHAGKAQRRTSGTATLFTKEVGKRRTWSRASLNWPRL